MSDFLKGISSFRVGEAATTFNVLPIMSNATLTPSSQDHFFVTRATIYLVFYTEKNTYSFPLSYLACMGFEELPSCLNFCLYNTLLQPKGVKLVCKCCMTAMTMWVQIFHQGPSSKYGNHEMFSWMCSTARGTYAIKAKLFRKHQSFCPFTKQQSSTAITWEASERLSAQCYFITFVEFGVQAQSFDRHKM